MALKAFKLDLHVHTCLSPCSDLIMLPSALVKQARVRNLDGIGVCDHNSAENVIAVKKAGKREGITVIGGIEINSREEVHILAYFDTDAALLEMQDNVYRNLSGHNDASHFGEQLVVDENDTILESNDRLLIGSTNLSIDAIVQKIHTLDGIAVASHIDRETNSIIGQLGFIPEDLPLDALELSARYKQKGSMRLGNYNLPFVTSSDAHFLDDVGTVFTTFLLEELSFPEMKAALTATDGRKVMI